MKYMQSRRLLVLTDTGSVPTTAALLAERARLLARLPNSKGIETNSARHMKLAAIDHRGAKRVGEEEWERLCKVGAAN